MKKIIALCTLSVSVSMTTLPFASAEQWTQPQQLVDGDAVSLDISESAFVNGGDYSRIEFRDTSQSNPETTLALCEQMGVAPCDGSIATSQYNVREVLPPCSEKISEWCIEGLTLYSTKDSSPKSDATLLRSIDGPILNKDEKSGLPQGGTISLWRAQGVENSAGADTYAVYLRIAGTTSGKRKFSFQDLNAVVLPYSEIKSGYSPRSIYVSTEPSGQKVIGGSGHGPDCYWVDVGTCGKPAEFPTQSRVTLKLRLGNSLTGWLMGRMANTDFQVSSLSATQNSLTIDSDPVVIPKFFATFPASKITPALAAISPAVLNKIPFRISSSSDSTPFEVVQAWADIAGERAVGENSVWSLSTMNPGDGSSCLTDKTKLLGFVSTNATIYRGEAPSFIDGFLDYKVWSQHLQSDGSVFKGKYDLVIRSEVARCLYGFTAAPISASISVISADGKQQVATTTVNESLGWLHLAANNFTFSNPTVKVRILQGKTSASTISTIHCVKGKLKKTVKSTSPKCPTGYKKA
jgi:hypothetical protein